MHSWWKVTQVACGFAVLVGALSSARSSAAAKVACVGDSITYGYGLSDPSQQSYPAVLQTLVGSAHTVQNFGSSGCTLLKAGDKPYWNDPAFSASDAFKPDVVVVMLGTNDAKPQNWSYQANFVGDYNSLVTHYRSLGALVYVAVPPPVFAPGAYSIDPTVFSDEVVPLIRQVATGANAPLIDVFQAMTGKSSDFPDTVHPNVEGSQLIAQTVAAALQQGGYGGAAGPTSTGGASPGTGGKTGIGGSAGTGGTAASSGGTSSTGGSSPNTGGASTSSGGASSTSGAKVTGGTAANSGGASGAAGFTQSTGATFTTTGGVVGSGGAAGAGGNSTPRAASSIGGQSGVSATNALGGQSGTDGGAGGSAHSSQVTSASGMATGEVTAESITKTANNPQNTSGCNCRVANRRTRHRSAWLAALALAALVRLRRKTRES